MINLRYLACTLAFAACSVAFFLCMDNRTVGQTAACQSACQSANLTDDAECEPGHVEYNYLPFDPGDGDGCKREYLGPHPQAPELGRFRCVKVGNECDDSSSGVLPVVNGICKFVEPQGSGSGPQCKENAISKVMEDVPSYDGVGCTADGQHWEGEEFLVAIGQIIPVCECKYKIDENEPPQDVDYDDCCDC